MTALNKLSFDSAPVHVWKASLEADDTQLAAWEASLDPAERVRAQRFHFERDRRRFTEARGLLRWLVARYTGLDPAAVQFALGPKGKPLLATPLGGLCFNLSHSGTKALFAFTAGREVGIDLEAGARLGEDWAGLARRIFSAREQAALAALPVSRQRDAFLSGWTRKEAYLKATGQGLIDGLQQIEVTLDPEAPPAFLSAEIARKWQLLDLRASVGLAAALVLEGDPAPVEFFDATGI